MKPQVVDFTRASTSAEAAKLLSVSSQLFNQLIDPIQKSNYYKLHRIPKRRSATHREVWECLNDQVAIVHKTFARRFHEFIKSRCTFPSGIAHGYVPGRSTVSNARQHVSKRVILRVDISDFFHSISIVNVETLFKSLGIDGSVAAALAELATLNSCLPLGLHASPTLANLACLRMDADLENLAAGFGATVTRYADDITFSGTSVPSLNTVEALLNRYNFQVSRTKCRLTKLGQAHYVTGLSVSDSVPRLPRRMKRRMRQELHFVRKFGLPSHITRTGDISLQSAVNRLDGMLRYFNAVEPTRASKLKVDWDRILIAERLVPAYNPLATSARAPVTILIDESEIPTDDGVVLAIAMILIVELNQVRDMMQKVAREYYVDPFAPGDKQALDDLGPHYTNDHPDLRTKVFESLELLPIRSFIAYDLLPGPNDYRQIYEKLFASLLKYRLMSCDGAEVEIVFEENSKVSLPRLQALTNKEFDKLLNANDRRPTSSPTVRLGSKRGDPCLAVADYVLAGFGHYAMLEKKSGEQVEKRFERLRDRIRVVLALPIGKAFGRKQPFLPWPNGHPTSLY
jgi:RNA-directed DNA polymerase